MIASSSSKLFIYGCSLRLNVLESIYSASFLEPGFECDIYGADGSGGLTAALDIAVCEGGSGRSAAATAAGSSETADLIHSNR